MIRVIGVSIVEFLQISEGKAALQNGDMAFKTMWMFNRQEGSKEKMPLRGIVGNVGLSIFSDAEPRTGDYKSGYFDLCRSDLDQSHSCESPDLIEVQH